MYQRLIALLVAVVVGLMAPQAAEAAPRPEPAAASTHTVAAAETMSVAIPVKNRKMTKASKHELKVALKIRQKAQRGKTLDFSKAWKATHDWTILKHYTYGLKLGGGRAVAGKADAAKLARVNSSSDRMVALAAKCKGKTDAMVRPYGYRIRLNSCWAKKAEYASAFTAASVALLTAVLPSPPPAKVVGAAAEFMFTVGVIQLAVCNRNSKGVRIFFTYATGAIPVFCRQQ